MIIWTDRCCLFRRAEALLVRGRAFWHSSWHAVRLEYKVHTPYVLGCSEKSKFVIFVEIWFSSTTRGYCTIVRIFSCNLSIPCLTHLSFANVIAITIDFSLLCLIDLTKCFDIIDHSIFLCKLGQYRVDTSWFAPYLSGHTQKVNFTDKACKQHISKYLPNKIGVFQGSSLGPLLYCLFSNDLSLFAASSDITQYADDTQVLVSGKKSALPALVSSMETALAALDSWFRANSLKVNASKTQLIVFGTRQYLQNFTPSEVSVMFRGVPLQPCTEVKTLGVVFDSHLSWDQHISLLTRAPLGHFYNAPHWGGAISSPPSDLRNYWTDSKNSSGIWKHWKHCRGKTNFIDLGVTSDVTGQVKVKMFDISGLVTSASEIAMLSTNKAN